MKEMVHIEVESMLQVTDPPQLKQFKVMQIYTSAILKLKTRSKK
jgi:hypothetical protein